MNFPKVAKGKKKIGIQSRKKNATTPKHQIRQHKPPQPLLYPNAPNAPETNSPRSSECRTRQCQPCGGKSHRSTAILESASPSRHGHNPMRRNQTAPLLPALATGAPVFPLPGRPARQCGTAKGVVVSSPAGARASASEMPEIEDACRECCPRHPSSHLAPWSK